MANVRYLKKRVINVVVLQQMIKKGKNALATLVFKTLPILEQVVYCFIYIKDIFKLTKTLDAVVIVCIIHPNGDKILLGRQKRWPKKMFSCISGTFECKRIEYRYNYK